MELKNNYALYIPSTMNGNSLRTGQHEELTTNYVNIMLEKFPGLTVIRGFGYWKNSYDIVIMEPVFIIKASTNFDVDAYILLLAKRIKSEMMQEAVSYEINGVLHII